MGLLTFSCVFSFFALVLSYACVFVVGYGYGRTDGRNLTVDTSSFNVIQGPPNWIAVLTPVADAWAGGQAFGTQPSVAVVDKGGNIVNSRECVSPADHTRRRLTQPSHCPVI